MHEKKGFRQVLERPEGVLGFSKTNFYFEQGKVAQELGNGHAIQFFWKKWRTIRNTIFYNAFLNWKEGIIEINGSNIPV